MDLNITPSGKVSTNIFNNIAKWKHEEYQYINAAQHILDNGFYNGSIKSIFGHSMRFSLQNGKIPILKTECQNLKTESKNLKTECQNLKTECQNLQTECQNLKTELLWFIRGETDTILLEKQGINSWTDSSSREVLNSRGLRLTKEGLIGPVYGYQWRHFNANYNCFSGKKILNDDQQDIHKNVVHFKGIDQLQQIIEQLKNVETRNSNTFILTSWNPCQIDQMAVIPSHILCQFNVHDGNKLSCALYQQSCNILNKPDSHIALYSFLTHLLANHCGLEAYECVYFIGKCYMYIEEAQPQIITEPLPFPTVSIVKIRENINDYLVEDFIIT